MCLAGAVVASWSLTQEVWQVRVLSMTNIFDGEFSENISEKSPIGSIVSHNVLVIVNRILSVQGLHWPSET